MAVVYAPHFSPAALDEDNHPLTPLMKKIKDTPEGARTLPALAHEFFGELAAPQKVALTDPARTAHALATQLMRKSRSPHRIHGFMREYLAKKLPEATAPEPAYAYGVFQAVLTEELLFQGRSARTVAEKGLGWQDGRLSPEQGGKEGRFPTLVIYPARREQDALVYDMGFRGPLRKFVHYAEKDYFPDPVRGPHYKIFLGQVADDLQHRSALPSLRQAVTQLGRT